MKTCSIILIVSAASALSWGTSAAAKKKAPPDNGDDVKGQMHLLLRNLQTVMPLAMDSRDFQDAKKMKIIKASLQSIQTSAHYLEKHGNAKDPSFAFVAKSLEESAQDALFWIKRDDRDEARFITLNLAENCISCHTNLPETSKFPPAAAFFDRLKQDGLTKKELLTLLIATRDFDGALAMMEKELLADPAAGGMPLTSDTLLAEYLKVGLRVKQDPGRVHKTLAMLRSQRKMPLYIERKLECWIDALNHVEHAKLLDDVSLENADRLMKSGKGAQDFPMDHNGDVYFTAASSVLNRLLQSPALGDEKKSEIFYDLGVAEIMIGRAFWLSKAEFYLENAIRLYPLGPHTLQAYTLLEEQLHMEYEGPSDLDMPDSKSRKLNELRQLLPAAQPK